MLENIRDKKIAIVGLGTNNRSLADFLSAQKINFEVIDNWKDKDELVGKLDNFDLVFRSPGLPFLSRAVQQAKSHGVEISSQTKLFFEACSATIIGVTGTKGKGTTSSLIAKILDAAGKKTWLAGNIGKDPFEFLDQVGTSDFVVLELSSFQLQDLDEYIAAKANIISKQSKNDFAVLHESLPGSLKNLGNGQKIIFDPQSVANWQTKLLGKHNLENIAAAVSVAKVLAIPENIVKDSVAEFEALPHRLKVLRIVNGITFVDDGFSTNIEPTIAAINAIDSKQILILGGSEKGLDFSSLGACIKNSPKIKGVVVIGEVAEKIVKSLAGFTGKILTGAITMTGILSQAQSLAQSGDTILFSPATASFGLFKNEFDRSDQFVKLVETL